MNTIIFNVIRKWKSKIIFLLGSCILSIGIYIHSYIEIKNFNRECSHQGAHVSTILTIDGFISIFAVPIYLGIMYLFNKIKSIDIAFESLLLTFISANIFLNIEDFSSYGGECFTMGGDNDVGETDMAFEAVIFLVDGLATILLVSTLGIAGLRKIWTFAARRHGRQ